MKKILLLALTLVLVAGCSSTSEEQNVVGTAYELYKGHPKIVADSPGTLQESIVQISKDLDEGKRQEFANAINAIFNSAMTDNGSYNFSLLQQMLDGKTVEEVIQLASTII